MLALLASITNQLPVAMNSRITSRQTNDNLLPAAKHDLSRRRFLGVGAAALAAAGIVPALEKEAGVEVKAR